MSANPYDGLPLGVPTVIADNADVQTIATRTANGGTVQTIAHPGGPTDLATQQGARIATAVAQLNALGAAAGGAVANAGNVVAVVNTILADLAVVLPRLADLIQALGKG